MLTVHITTSVGVHSFSIQAAIEDELWLDYASCAYCQTTIRTSAVVPMHRKFCSAAHRKNYCVKEIRSC